ncbi:zinc finger protein GLI2 [Podospora aff. communis PSN243]|uniref:Zinc finger protein GLI2 n=1 Tax=Podospora aff. communis PSN243 TaxID=3040156 RepID=A0AAV9G952_9PEZI|nr:zinc finger protein GLI2 [Podospora aff. communis PSN243]
MLSSASGMFSSFCHTGPADLGGSSWDATAEGSQNFPEFTDAGDYYTGDAEEFYPYGHITPKPDHNEPVDDMHSTWTAGKAPKAEPMRRMISSTSSTRSHKHRSIKTSSSSNKKSRSRVPSILSQTSSQMSKLDMTGNAGAYEDRSVINGHMMDPHQFLAQDLDTLSVSSHMNNAAFYSGIVDYPDGLHYSNDMGASVAHVNPQVFDNGLTTHSPQSWGSLSPAESRFSSPGAADGGSDDVWSASPGASQHSNSPALAGQSPRMTRKADASQYVNNEDLHGNMMPSMSQDGFALPPAFGSRRMSGEGESARDHFLYKNAYPQADGLFHCPWEGESTCNHKPEKLKCNYDKFVDSHLKPYRCKVEGCQNARFSSTACLLRHEREAHAMHGHGEKPYLCTYEGCERSQPGHGFPRQWNLRDHMRRVHNDNGTTSASSSSAQAASPPPAVTAATSARGRKRKNDGVQQEKTSSEKSSSRKNSSSSKAAEAAKAAEAEWEMWYKHQKELQSLVHGYTQPDDPATLQYIKEAQDHLTAMGKISHDLVVSNKSDLLQGGYRRSWTKG